MRSESQAMQFYTRTYMNYRLGPKRWVNVRFVHPSRGQLKFSKISKIKTKCKIHLILNCHLAQYLSNIRYFYSRDKGQNLTYGKKTI